MDHQLVAALLLILLSPRIYGKSECMQIVGTLVCPQKPMLAGNVQIDLKDEDRKIFGCSMFILHIKCLIIMNTDYIRHKREIADHFLIDHSQYSGTIVWR